MLRGDGWQHFRKKESVSGISLEMFIPMRDVSPERNSVIGNIWQP